MVRQRVLAWSIAAVIGTAILASGLPGFLATLAFVGIHQSASPSSVSWEAKNAYVKCSSAIADPTQWPRTPVAACAAMHLCANEAPLSARETAVLSAAIGDTPGCAPP